VTIDTYHDHFAFDRFMVIKRDAFFRLMIKDQDVLDHTYNFVLQVEVSTQLYTSPCQSAAVSL